MAITCSKIYSDVPFAHRAPNHDGHCAQIHGHNWSFEFEFKARTLDKNGFVMDFGKLKFIKEKLDQWDHALLLAQTDPELPHLMETLDATNLAVIQVVPDCSCEGIAGNIGTWVSGEVYRITDGRVTVTKCTVYEDSKNSATWYNG